VDRSQERTVGYLKQITGALEFELFEMDEWIANGDNVVVLGRERCPVKRTGKVVEANWAQVWTFRAGSISRYLEYSEHCGVGRRLSLAELDRESR